MQENKLSYHAIGKAFEIHKNLGPGLLESAYEAALVYELRLMGYDVKQQYKLSYQYKEVLLDPAYRLDILLDNKLIIEIKSVETLAPVHFSQTLTYLKLSGLRLALLINFNCSYLKNNIHRLIN